MRFKVEVADNGYLVYVYSSDDLSIAHETIILCRDYMMVGNAISNYLLTKQQPQNKTNNLL